MHGIISNVSSAPSVSIDILGDTLEFGYPSLCYAGLSAGDDDAFIVVDHTSDTTNPGNSVIFYKNGAYSASKRLYSGNSIVNVLDSIADRWGDYSGVQRRYNEPGKAWAAAFYGSLIGTPPTTTHGEGARISEIQSPLLPHSAIAPIKSGISGVEMYPVPTSSYKPVNVIFTSPQDGYYDFRIYDIGGKLVTCLLREKVEEGKNRFTFSTSPLKPGIYMLSISSGQSAFTQKFVVE
jgi:hypothetical protein